MPNNKPQDQQLLGAAYIRYSSSMQDDSFSLEAQLRQIKARAAADGVEIVKVYADPATSAYQNKYRPGIAEMLDDSRKGVFSTLYVHKVDRLARRLEVSIEIVKKLQSVDVTLKAVEQNFDLATPEGKLMFHLLGSLGEFYSDNLSKETHKGKYERAKQGYHNGWVSWGYKSEMVGDHKLAVPDPELGPVVVQVYERFATGLYYDQDMADWMNEQGYKTMFKHPFTKDAMRDMLQNPFYKGYVLYREPTHTMANLAVKRTVSWSKGYTHRLSMKNSLTSVKKSAQKEGGSKTPTKPPAGSICFRGLSPARNVAAGCAPRALSVGVTIANHRASPGLSANSMARVSGQMWWKVESQN